MQSSPAHVSEELRERVGDRIHRLYPAVGPQGQCLHTPSPVMHVLMHVLMHSTLLNAECTVQCAVQDRTLLLLCLAKRTCRPVAVLHSSRADTLTNRTLYCLPISSRCIPVQPDVLHDCST